MNLDYIKVEMFNNMNTYYLFYSNGHYSQFDLNKELLEHERTIINTVVSDDIDYTVKFS